MAKLTKWEKIELLTIYKNERKDARCLIVLELTKKANKLTGEINILINDLQSQLKNLHKERDDILLKNHLSDFDNTTNYTCKINTLHQKLILFDKETNIEIQKIIREE